MTPESSIVDGYTIPNGKLVSSNVNNVLQCDEKIICDSNQFCMKYILLAKFN
jgi:hypothetical protein